MAMRLYEVGGAVRDALLGLPATDRDWVAVGATPDELLALGYKPVGRDFPVFLQPDTGEEVALARTERKSGRGYHGFSFHADPSVTLEEDLRRRDLTINAMARDASGRLIDPYGGERDLHARVLRHVSDAFVEDPVRLLRVARLAARFHDFSVAPETLALLRRMVEDGEVDHLVAERVWQELSRGLMEQRPSRMLQVLDECGALQRLLPEVRASAIGIAQRGPWLDDAAALGMPLAVRYACLCDEVPDAPAIAARWRVPHECAELAALHAREGHAVLAADALDAAALVRLFTRSDAWRRPARWQALLQALAVRHGSRVPTATLQRALQAAAAVDTGAVATQAAAKAASAAARGDAIAAAVAAARARAIAATANGQSASSAH